MDLFQQHQGLPVINRIGEALTVMRFSDFFCRDFSVPGSCLDEIAQNFFSAADKQSQLAILIPVLANQCQGAFAIDQSRQVSSISKTQGPGFLILLQASSTLKNDSPANAGDQIGGGGGTANPLLSKRAGLYLHPFSGCGACYPRGNFP